MREQGVRWLVAAIGLIIGFHVALTLVGILSRTHPLPLTAVQATGLVLAAALAGGVIGHRAAAAARVLSWLTRAIDQRVPRAPRLDLLAGTAGAVVALVIAFLAGPAFRHLGWWVRGLATLILVYLGVAFFLPRAEMTVRIVENGRRYHGEEMESVVPNVIQNAQGRMIFGRPRGLVSAQ